MGERVAAKKGPAAGLGLSFSMTKGDLASFGARRKAATLVAVVDRRSLGTIKFDRPALSPLSPVPLGEATRQSHRLAVQSR